MHSLSLCVMSLTPLFMTSMLFRVHILTYSKAVIDILADYFSPSRLFFDKL